ncbi:unnamed protein product, partial [Prorocentrum cordatum]
RSSRRTASAPSTWLTYCPAPTRCRGSGGRTRTRCSAPSSRAAGTGSPPWRSTTTSSAQASSASTMYFWDHRIFGVLHCLHRLAWRQHRQHYCFFFRLAVDEHDIGVYVGHCHRRHFPFLPGCTEYGIWRLPGVVQRRDDCAADLHPQGRGGPPDAQPPRGHGVYSFISINSQQIRALSGVSTALGQSSGISSTLTGVTVAASLLPPLVNSGLCTVFGLVYPGMRTKDDHTLHSIALVSFFMYFVTVVFVMVFCYLTFKFKHVGGSSFRIQSENRLTIRERAMSTLQSMSFFGRGSRASVPNPAASPSAESQSLHRPRSEMGTELISASRGGSFADDAKDRKVGSVRLPAHARTGPPMRSVGLRRAS